MFNIVRSIFPTAPVPTKVLQVMPDTYAKRDTICCEDDLVLYAPHCAMVARFRYKPKFEIVLHKPSKKSVNRAFSLYRADDQADAEKYFNYLKGKLPIFIKNVKEMEFSYYLQDICDIIAQHPSWTMAHMAAHFLLYDAFDNNIISSHLNSIDSATGMSPLHAAIATNYPKTILIDQNHIEHACYNSKNKLRSILALLCRGVKINIKDGNGNTPLHLAINTENNSIIQCLIIFGADVNALNHKGETPRHMVAKRNNPRGLYSLHAVGAKRCAADVYSCLKGCKHNRDYNGEPPPSVAGPINRDLLNDMLSAAAMHNFPKKGRLLCLDGGGIRGLILIQMLLELEAVREAPITNCFDWISGTSTGGILALALGTGKTLKECQRLYFRFKEQAFTGMRPYRSEPLERLLKESLGSKSVMTDIKQPKLLIPGVLADRKPAELHLFRNYESPSDILGVHNNSPYELPKPPEETLLWHVARATGAAPTYFKAFDKFLDGGLIANNPTLDALTEIHEYNLALKAKHRVSEQCPVNIVVSLGTGVVPVIESKIYNMLPESIWQGTKLVYALPALASLLVDQATATDGRVVDRARAWCSSLGIPYFRFSPYLSEDIAMDEKSDERLCNMLWETKAYMYANMASVRDVARYLESNKS